MSDDGNGGEWAASESKDWKDGRHRRENRHVLPHGGEVTDRTSRQIMSVYERVHARAVAEGWIRSDEWPAKVVETRHVSDRLDYHVTEAFSKRLEAGDAAGMRHHVGSQSDEIDVSGWRDIERIREWVTDRHLRLYIYGEPGNGKTRSGCLAARHWLDERRDEGRTNARILTNVRTLVGEDPSIEWVSNWGDFNGRIHADIDDVLAENVTPSLFLFDEASSQASGSGKDGWEASTKLAVLIYKMRKYGVATVIIGHDGKDLHPAVRELCIALHKTDKKDARFYRSVNNRKGVGPLTSEIKGWPDSMWKPNDKDPAPWSWSDGSGDDSDDSDADITKDGAFRQLAIWTVVHERTREIEDDEKRMSFDKIARRRLDGAYSGEWCRKRWNEYDRGEHGETVAKVQKSIA